MPERVLVGTRGYLRAVYADVAHWLERKGGPTWRVDHFFIWCLDSWDVLGAHPGSGTAGEGSYADPVVQRIVVMHNQALREPAGTAASQL